MEKRSVSSLALMASGATVLVGVVLLLVRVKSAATAPALAPDELARAASSAPAAARSAQPAEQEPKPRFTPKQLPQARHPGATLRSGVETAPAPAPAQGQASTLESKAAEASSFYGRGEYESARSLALEVLGQKPDQFVVERMLRIAASSSCFMGDVEQARSFHDQLSPKGKLDIEKRCKKVGIDFR